MKNLVSVLMVLIIGFGLIIGLQIFLSSRKNKWWGLIMPLLGIGYSLIIVGSMVAFNETSTTVTIHTEDGTVIEKVEGEGETLPSKNIGKIVGTSIILFIVSNIPTLIYLAIYFGCREKLKKNQQLKNMQIQDLE
ncbi:MAG: hypothetical protein J6F30_13945 [Cellulosilyticum sp.]|nr:hypothetical protein [Cellulosilyticum sp.]